MNNHNALGGAADDLDDLDALDDPIPLEQMLNEFVHLPAHRFTMRLSNMSVVTEDEMREEYGAPDSPVVDRWLASEQRLTADTLGFDPAEPRFFTAKDGSRRVNLWRQLDWSPPRDWEERVEPFLDHMENMIPDAKARNDLLDWLAHMYQRPGERPAHHFLLMVDGLGSGIGWLNSFLRESWGRFGATISMYRPPNSFLSGLLSHKVYVGLDDFEANFDTTEPCPHRLVNRLLAAESITVGGELLPSWDERFVARLLMMPDFTTTGDAYRNDPRVYVVGCADRRPSSSRYAALDDCSFIDSVVHWMLQRDISKFDPKAPAPTGRIHAPNATYTRCLPNP
jgi:hypothetical protein